MVLGVGQAPLRDVVEVGEERVTVDVGVDARQVHPIGAVDHLPVDLRAAGDEDLGVAAGDLQRAVDRRRDDHVVRAEIVLPRDDDRRPSRQRPSDRLERLPPHD